MSSTAITAGLLLGVEIACTVAVAVRCTRRVVGPADPIAWRWTVGLVLALAQLIGVMIVCGALAILYPITVLAGHLLAAAVVFRAVRPAPRPVTQTRRRWSPEELVLGAVVAVAGALALQLTLSGPLTQTDDINYHVPNAVFWVQTHSLWSLPFSNPGYFTNAYPSDGELLGSWLLLPVHGTQVVGVATLAFGALLLAAGTALAVELGASTRRGGLATLALLLAPLSFQGEVHSLLTDWPATAGLVAAAAAVLRSRRAPSRGADIVAGLALGISVGSKDTSLLPAVGVLVLAAVLLPRPQRLRSLITILAGTAALSAVWFVRNAIDAHNPVYPEPVRLAGRTILGGGVGPVTEFSTSLFQDVVHGDGHALHIWFDGMRTFIGPAALIGLAVVVGLLRLRRQRILFACSLLAIACFAVYLVTPYTGPVAAPELIVSQLRYAFPALFLAASCVAAALPRAVIVAWVGVAWGLFKDLHHATFRTGYAPSGRMLAVAVLAAVAAVVLAARRGRAAPAAVIVGAQHRGRAPLAGVRGAVRALPVASWSLGARVAAVSVVAGAGILAVTIDRQVPPPTPVDIALARVGRPHGSVMVLGAVNVLGAVGSRFDHRLISPAPGNLAHADPFKSVAALDDELRATAPAAVVVGPLPTPGLPTGWRPPGYRYAGSLAPGSSIYVASPPSIRPASGS